MSNTMEYTRVGKSGLKVSRIILGCMSYGNMSPWMLPEDQALEHIKTAYDLGINAFDTSNNYSNGQSEIIVGKAIKQFNLPRDEIVVMTKVYTPVGRDGAILWGWPTDKLEAMRYTNQHGLSRKHILGSVKHSLERLQLDYVDILQCHRFDYNTPVEETMQALHDVVKAGYVRYIGMSSCFAWQFFKMQNYAKRHGLTEFILLQPMYSAVYREEEREMVPLLKDLGVGMVPWSPLGAGFLTRPLKNQQEATKRSTSDFINGYFVRASQSTHPWSATINERVEAVAKAHDVSMAQVCVAWALSKDFMTAPIIGTTSIEKLKDVVAGIHLKLTEDEIKSIDEPYQPQNIIGFH